MSTPVQFYKGREEVYITAYTTNSSLYDGIIFFATDAHKIYYKGVAYGGSGTSGEISTELAQLLSTAIVEASVEQVSDGTYVLEFVQNSGEAFEYTIKVATQEKSGLMSKEDKTKLDLIDSNNIVYIGGEGSSSNDYTDADQTKLSEIEEGALINVIETIKVDGSIITPTNKVVNLAITDKINEVVGDKISSAYVYKRTVANASDLPVLNNTIGDVYNIENASEYGAAGVNVAWNGNSWDSLGGVVSTLNVDQEISALKTSTNDLLNRVENLEDLGISNHFSSIDNAIEILNSDESTAGSVSHTATNIATTIINNVLTWKEL